MRQRDSDHLRELMRRLSSLDKPLSRSEALSLLILLREVAPTKSMLRDLGHSVAHAERDKGLSFDYLEKFTMNVRRVLIHGGNLHSKILFPIVDVIGEINGVLAHVGIEERLPKDDPGIQYALANPVADALDGTSYKLRVAVATLSYVGTESGYPQYLATIRFKHDIEGAITLPADGRGLGFPWLMGIDEVRPSLESIIARQQDETPTRSGD